MENLVSKSRLLWQQLHTTPPPVVLSLYLQNAQLSPKPALCWEETAVCLSLFLCLAHSLSVFYWRQSSNTSTLPLSYAGDEWGSHVMPLNLYKIICVCISLWSDLNLQSGRKRFIRVGNLYALRTRILLPLIHTSSAKYWKLCFFCIMESCGPTIMQEKKKQETGN